MFYDLEEDKFPVILIKFNKNRITDKNFNEFTSYWEKLYEKNQDFILIFDTTNMRVPHIKYAFKMTTFIKKLRKKDPQRLQKSIIILKNKIIANMVDLVFYIQPPVAPVLITYNTLDEIKTDIKYHDINIEYNTSSFKLEKSKIIKKFKPKKPYFAFL